MRTNLLTCLFGCLGFVVGFVLCFLLFVPAASERTMTTFAPMASERAVPTGVPVQERPDLVTIVNPTFPPQIMGTFDPLQKVAEQMEAPRANR